MLNKLAFSGALLTAFAGAALATPAHAATPGPDGPNTAAQSRNVIVCGNSAIGDIFNIVGSIAPVTFATQRPVDCSIHTYQNANPGPAQN